MPATTFKKRTPVAYTFDQSSTETVVNVLGVFHGGQDWEADFGDDVAEENSGG